MVRSTGREGAAEAGAAAPGESAGAESAGSSTAGGTPAPERLAERMWEQDAASAALGMELQELKPGRATVRMRVRADMVNGWDICHGGLIASLADSTFALACNALGRVTVASGFDIEFLEPARLGEELIATAEPRAARGRSGLWDVSVRRTSDGTVLAEFRGRARVVKGTAPADGT